MKHTLIMTCVLLMFSVTEVAADAADARVREAELKHRVEIEPGDAAAWHGLGYLEWKFTHPTDEKLGWERFKDAFTYYRKAIELKPDNAQYLLEFDELAEEVGISVSERYRMLRSHHDAVARLPAALERECRTATVEGDYDYALGLGLDENLPCVVNARILRDRECGRRPEIKSVPSECEIPYRWARGEDLTELLASAKAEPGTYKAFWLSGLRALQAGKPLEARGNFIRAIESKNDFVWAKVMLYSILPEWRPVVRFERIGTLKASGRPDPRDDRWMIGCELQDRDFTNFDAYKEYLPGLGIRKARFQCGWAKCEKTRGVYDFAWIDKCVDFCLAHGIDPVLETDYGNTIYPGGGGIDLSGGFPYSEEALAAWDRWVDALTKHFKGRVTWWAMWNEPDIKPLHSIYGKDQSKSPSAIAAFNVRTAKIVKRNIPDARIAGLSLNDTNPVFFGDCLKAMGDDVKLFDRFIYHGYDHVPEETYERVMKLQEVCARLAPQARMWQGENGAPSERAGDEHALSHTWWTEGTQVKWDLRRMIGDIAHGVPCCVFTICDFYHFGRGIGNYGLVRASNSKRVLGKKLAYDAVANCVTVFGPDTQLVAKQKKFIGDPRVQLWHFEKKGMPIVAFWFGTERPTPTTKVEEVSLDVSQFGFKDPVWVDLGSGAVYAFPKDAKTVPMCDSPCLLAERAAIDLK